ncbi:MAG TPA: hypothetical protein VJH70_00265 [Candidatus Paceibacterota bacterium]
MKPKYNPLDVNLVKTTLVAFMESYNKSIPIGFPHASVKVLKQFQESYPVLFKGSNEWSIDKHRKKVMDWLPSYSEKNV